jgi:hypothetical protein
MSKMYKILMTALLKIARNSKYSLIAKSINDIVKIEY